MPKSDNIVTVRLNEKQMKAYHNGKTFTLKPSDITDLSNHEVRLHFSAKKHINRLNKNFNKGTGTRISASDLEDIKVKTGDGIFDSIKGVMSSKVVKGIAKSIAPQVGQIVGNQIKNLTGSDMAGNLTSTLIKEGSKEAFGNGFLSNIMKSNITKGIAKSIAPQVGQIVGNKIKSITGSDMAGNLTSTLIKEGSKEAFGGSYRLHGVKRVSKKGGSFLQLGGSIHQENVKLANMDLMNNGVGLTATAPHFSDPTPMQRKMSELRAMRGRKNI